MSKNQNITETQALNNEVARIKLQDETKKFYQTKKNKNRIYYGLLIVSTLTSVLSSKILLPAVFGILVFQLIGSIMYVNHNRKLYRPPMLLRFWTYKNIFYSILSISEEGVITWSGMLDKGSYNKSVGLLPEMVLRIESDIWESGVIVPDHYV